LFRIIGAGVSVVVTQNLGGGQREAANKVACAVVGASTWWAPSPDWLRCWARTACCIC
jgi:Na+-driven multidrug efflux pump